MKKNQLRYTHHTQRYANILLVVIGIIVALTLSRYEPFREFLIHLGGYGYLGAAVAGLLFVSTFTVSTGALILAILAEDLHPIELGLAAGVGAVLGDLTILRIWKDGLLDEVMDIYQKIGGKKISHILHAKAFRWSLPVIGALIIASPLPDELGIGLMGLARVSTWRFILLSFILNSLGIYLVITASQLIAP